MPASADWGIIELKEFVDNAFVIDAESTKFFKAIINTVSVLEKVVNRRFLLLLNRLHGYLHFVFIFFCLL